MDELSRRILDLEKMYPRYGGVKDHAIRERFDMSATSYYQLLNQLLDDPEATAAEPVLINGLRRIRAQKGSDTHGYD